MSEPSLRRDTLRHKVGMCPACRDYLWAEVVVESRTSEPTLAIDGQAAVYASARPVAMTVTHTCTDDEPEPADMTAEPKASASEVSASDEGVSS